MRFLMVFTYNETDLEKIFKIASNEKIIKSLAQSLSLEISAIYRSLHQLVSFGNENCVPKICEPAQMPCV